jgi:GH25 family lysozyme M1 (1,4-beta-N-acetylmuramidase)
MQPSVTVGGASYSVTGIDVSSHDHDTNPIDWASVAASGVNFAYIKATEGTPPDPYVNPYFASDFQAAKANGLYAGAYAFARPDLGDPAGQADVLVDRSGWSPDGKTLIPMLDLEGPYGSLTQKFDMCWNMTGSISAWIRSFVTEVQVRTGRPPVIYTSATWWNTCTKSDSSFGSYPLNIADWTNPQPTVPAGWSNFAFWQYAGGDPSVAGNYDKDVFNGDLATLATYAGGSTFTSAGPTRVLDTRDGTGTGTAAAVAASSSISLQVAGTNGVPASGVTAVVLNVTVTAPTTAGYLTVYPDGHTQPTASNLNFTAGQTIPNLVTVPVINGKVDFFNGSSGSVHLIADLAGYFY